MKRIFLAALALAALSSVAGATVHLRADFTDTTPAVPGAAAEWAASHTGSIYIDDVAYVTLNNDVGNTPPNCLLYSSAGANDVGGTKLYGWNGAGGKINEPLAAGMAFRARVLLPAYGAANVKWNLCKSSDWSILAQFIYNGDYAHVNSSLNLPTGVLSPWTGPANIANSVGYIDHGSWTPTSNQKVQLGVLDVCFYVREQSGANWVVECWVKNDNMMGASPHSRDWFPVMRGLVANNNVAPMLHLTGYAEPGSGTWRAPVDTAAVDYMEFSVGEFDPATESRWRYIANTNTPGTESGMNTGGVAYVPSSSTVVALCQDGTAENDADWHVDAYTSPSPFTSWTKIAPDSTPLFQADTNLTANGDAGGGAQTPEVAGWLPGHAVTDNNGGAEWLGSIVAVAGNVVTVQMQDGYTADSVTVASGINNTTRTDTATLASKADLHNVGNPGLLWLGGTTVLAWCNRGFYPGVGDVDRWIVGRISTDSGATWGAEFDIVPYLLDHDYIATATGCVLRNGRICVPVHDYYTGVKTNHIAYSDDGGTTWTLSATMGFTGHNEPTCCQMANGQLLVACRDNDGNFLKTVVCVAPETDLDTWATAVEHDGNSGRAYIPNGATPLSLIADRDKVYLFSNGGQTGRRVIGVYVSDDNGATWEVHRKSPVASNKFRAPIYPHAVRHNRTLFLSGYTYRTGVVYIDAEWFPDQKMIEGESGIHYAP